MCAPAACAAARSRRQSEPALSPLRRADLLPDPTRQFRAWFDEAREAGVPTPEAVALGTASAGGRPSVRMVLLRGADERGFRFYTGYESRKGAELAANPVAALCFHWQAVGRQVRVEGRVERLDPADSDAYFASRPLDSRLGAWASDQSTAIPTRAALDEAMAAAGERFADGQVPRPSRWGGFLLAPDAFEFWQHGDHRLHDRFRYTPGAGGWVIERLAP
ncbi:MAG: pyridoxamine 5'-phosphate oxidase [Gaiellales bacterium]